VTVTFEVVDPSHPDARRALVAYLDEVASRMSNAVVSSAEADDVDDYRAPSGMFLVVRDEHSNVVGCGALRELDESTGEIKRMWVDVSQRGRGVGRALLAALEARASVAGWSTLRLDTNGVLGEAIALYESHGYQRIDRYNDNPDATEFFEKRLR
jgi:ribosomal protein S18 acetylase RimI-like enzyme